MKSLLRRSRGTWVQPSLPLLWEVTLLICGIGAHGAPQESLPVGELRESWPLFLLLPLGASKSPAVCSLSHQSPALHPLGLALTLSFQLGLEDGPRKVEVEFSLETEEGPAWQFEVMVVRF